LLGPATTITTHHWQRKTTYKFAFTLLLVRQSDIQFSRDLFGSAFANPAAAAAVHCRLLLLPLLTSCIIEATRQVLVDWRSIIQVAILLVASWLASQQPVPGWQAATHLTLVENKAVAQQGAVIVLSTCL
jgi:hypothetical protein